MIRWGFRKISVMATQSVGRKESRWEVMAIALATRYISRARQVGAWGEGMRDTEKSRALVPGDEKRWDFREIPYISLKLLELVPPTELGNRDGGTGPLQSHWEHQAEEDPM